MKQACFSIHKRKNVKRLDKKERLRETTVQNITQNGDNLYNPFMPMEDETPAATDKGRLGGKYLAIARGDRNLAAGEKAVITDK